MRWRPPKDLLAYLRVIVDHDDDQALARILNVPPRYLGSAFQEALQSLSMRRGTSTYRQLGIGPFPKPYMAPRSQELRVTLDGLHQCEPCTLVVKLAMDERL
jgi:hypothetical protein